VQLEITTDFLVIGTGIAGLSFAIKAAGLGTVAMVTKKDTTDSNTNMAQGGIAVVQDAADRFEYHINDTLTCGAGLCNEEVVRIVVTEGPERVRELVQWGVEFTRSAADPDRFDLGREGGHSMRRVLHAKDLTGREIERALQEKAGQQANIRILNAVAKRMGLTEDKIYLNLEKYGNMSAASSAVALVEAVKEGRIKKGEKMLLDAFGGGLTWGAMVIEW